MSGIYLWCCFHLSVLSDSIYTVQAVRILLLPLSIVTGHPLLGATGKTYIM